MSLRDCILIDVMSARMRDMTLDVGECPMSGAFYLGEGRKHLSKKGIHLGEVD